MVYFIMKERAIRMKIRTRLIIAFLIITVVPISLIYIMILGLNNYQGKIFSETYGLEEQVDKGRTW